MRSAMLDIREPHFNLNLLSAGVQYSLGYQRLVEDVGELDLEAISDSVRRFAERRLRGVAKLVDQVNVVPEDVFGDATNMGYFTLRVPGATEILVSPLSKRL